MAKISAHGAELFRYFSLKRRALMVCYADGTRLGKSAFSNGWVVVGRKKAGCDLDTWLQGHKRVASDLPAWARSIKSLPSQAQLEEWVSDCACETPTGDTVEPDGHGPDGAPSWLLLLGLI